MRFLKTVIAAALPMMSVPALGAILPPQWPKPPACTDTHCDAVSPLGRWLTLDFPSAPLTTMSDRATLCLIGEELRDPHLGLYVPGTQQEGGPLTASPAGPGCVTLSHFSMRQAGTWRLTLQFNVDDSAYFDLVVTP